MCNFDGAKNDIRVDTKREEKMSAKVVIKRNRLVQRECMNE